MRRTLLHALLALTLALLAGGCSDETKADDPPAPLLEEYELQGEEAYPESVAFDPVERAFYTGSMALGNVTRIDADGTESTFFEGNDTGDWLALGLEVDVQRRRLWVCAALGKGFTESELWVLDLETGQRLWQTSLEGLEAGAACIDVFVAPDGVGYVADRSFPNVYRADVEDESLSLFATDPVLEPGVIGQNGITLTEDGQHLLTVNFLPATLNRISLADPTDVRSLDLKALAPAALSGGADALVVHEGFVYIAVLGQLLRVAPNEDFSDAQVDVLDLTRADGSALTGVSGLAVAEGALYVSKSDVLGFAVGSEPRLPFLLRRIEPAAFP